MKELEELTAEIREKLPKKKIKSKAEKMSEAVGDAYDQRTNKLDVMTYALWIMAKEQKIQEAYGKFWDEIKLYLNIDGWCDFKAIWGDRGNCKGLGDIELEIMDPYDPKYCYWKRPVSLEGIENNNGWIKIESEEDLPKLTVEFYVVKNGALKNAYYTGDNRWLTDENPYPKTTELHGITHYQPIEKPEPPIY